MTDTSSHPSTAPNSTHAKALAVNLEPGKFGSFAEIGAGQEVARWFLRVGGAAGTVAQTISAYDKTFSDDTYGGGTRYVSRERLLAMLDHEYRLLVERLGPTRGSDTRFFVFADTVAARNFKGDNEQHGWIGLRFQSAPGEAPNDILLHVNLMDPTAQSQQEALGVLGVNLVYAAFFQRERLDPFLGGLFEHLSLDRLEVDVIDVRGPALAELDAATVSLRGLRRGMARALVFDSDGHVCEPSSLLRKRPLIIERGRFAALQRFHTDMLAAAERQLRNEGAAAEHEPAPVTEMTLQPLNTEGIDDDQRVMDTIRRLGSIGTVIVSDFPQNYLLIQYVRRYTTEPIRMVLGVSALIQLMQEAFYRTLPGTLLEGLGKLLATNVKVYVYPMPRDGVLAALPSAGALMAPGGADSLVTADDTRFGPPLEHLYRYLRDAGWIVPLDPA
jgi:hypothetical protein